MSTVRSETSSEREAGSRVMTKDSIQRWLLSSAASLRARNALVIVRQGDKTLNYGSIPRNAKPDCDLENVASAAIAESVKIQRLMGASGTPEILVGLSLRVEGRPAAIAFRVVNDKALTDDELMRQVRIAALRRDEDDIQSQRALASSMGSESVADSVPQVTPQAILPAAISDDALANHVEQQGFALDMIATLLGHNDSKLASRAWIDSLAAHFSCHKISIGLVQGNRTVIEAVSGSSGIDLTSAAVESITLVLEETVRVASMITLPTHRKVTSPPPIIQTYATSAQCEAVACVPLVDGAEVVGAIVLERDEPFSEQDLELINQLVLIGAPVIALKQDSSIGLFHRLGKSVRKGLGSLFGFTGLGVKLTVLAVLAFVIWSTQYTRVFTVDASAAIEATVQRAVVAGANSYVSQVEKRAGDVIFKGDVLARLDVEELQLELMKWRSERDKLSKEQRAVLAQRDRSRVRILSAKYAQAQTQIDFLEGQISRAVLRAPIDGVVISGDLSEALGSPVERGQVLFEVASLEDYRLVLMVDETEVGNVSIDYVGRLRLKSLPHETFEFTVTNITPVAEAGQGMNRFRLEAELLEVPATLRPGMEGIAKIEAGEKAIGWIWTRKFYSWARLQLWRLGGI